MCLEIKLKSEQAMNYLTCGEPKDNQGLNSVTATEFPIDIILSFNRSCFSTLFPIEMRCTPLYFLFP